MKTSLPPFLIGLICLLATGCNEHLEIDRTVPPYYSPSNVYVNPQGWGAMPSRVLLLPSWGRASMVTLQELDEAVAKEAGKLNAFEVIPMPRSSTLRQRPDQDYTLEEAQKLARQVSADGVLLCRVTSSQPYKPMVLGVALRVWNISTDSTVWAVDETLDSQQTLVANGARNYYLTTFRESYPTRRSEKILESPKLFYQYVFSELFSVFPKKTSQKPQ